MPNITYKSRYYLFIPQPEKFHNFQSSEIGFKVLVFGPAGPDIAPGRCTFLSVLVF